MTRKDSEKEAERPHYYSQFWLDVAAGRKIIGGPKTADEAEAEPEPEPAPPARKSTRSSHEGRGHAAADGRGETIVHPVVEPIAPAEEFAEPDLDEAEEEEFSEEAQPDDELQYQDVAEDEEAVPEMDLAVDEEENYYDEQEQEEEEAVEEEEEEEDDAWGRGRKKPKPGQQKKPAPKKQPRRDRRSY